MMTSSNGHIFRVTGHLCGEFTGPGEFPTQRPVTRSFDVFFDLRLNKRLSKQSWGWWCETQSGSLWRHCNVTKMDQHTRGEWVIPGTILHNQWQSHTLSQKYKFDKWITSDFGAFYWNKNKQKTKTNKRTTKVVWYWDCLHIVPR